MVRASAYLALLLSIAWSGSGVSPASAAPALALASAPASDGKSDILFLHYRWRQDSFVLLEKKWLRGAVKPLRSESARSASSGSASGGPSGLTLPILSPIGYELLSARGEVLSTRFLRDPSVRTVETTEKGESVPRRHVRQLDSSDIFLRIASAEAKTIRFYRHAPGYPSTGPLPKHSGGIPIPPVASVAAPGKTLLAEFPLE